MRYLIATKAIINPVAVDFERHETTKFASFGKRKKEK